MSVIQHTVRWADNTEQLKKNLKEGLNQIEATRAGAEKMAQSLGGEKLIQAAHRLAAGIQEIGGATKLTDAEQAKANATLQKAIEKYTALGQTAPKAIVDLELATRDLDKQNEQTWKKLGEHLNTFATGAKTVGLGLTAALTAPILGVAGAAIKLGMDAIESENLVAVSFGDMKAKADDWSKDLSKTLGLNQFELRKTAGTIFNMTTSMGLNREAAFDMSTGVAKLAADMASFRNIPMDEALQKIRSGLVGESEPLKNIGILVDEATIKNEAYATGIAKQGAELTNVQKVQARWSAILRQTTNDQGDLARTMDSPSNQLRIMKTRLEEAATTLGIQLMPYVTAFIGKLSELAPKAQAAVEWFGALPEPVKQGAIALALLTAGAGPAIYALGTMASAVQTLIPLMATLSGEQAIGAVTAALPTFTRWIQAAGSSSLLSATQSEALGMTLKGLGSIAAVTGAAFAGWQLGRLIAQVFDLDNKIANLTARILHMGDVQKETAGAKQDVINRAIERGAAATISYTDAIKFNDEWLKKRNAALAAAAQEQQRTTGAAAALDEKFAKLSTTLQASQAEINQLSAAAKAKLAEAFKSGAFTMEELEKATGLSSGALKLFQKNITETAKEQKAATHETDEFEKKIKQLASDIAGATKAGMPLPIMLEKFGKAAADAATDAAVLGRTAPKAILDIALAFQKAEMDERALETFKRVKRVLDDQWEDIVRGADANAKKIGEAFLKNDDVMRAALKKSRDLDVKDENASLKTKLAAVDAWAKDEKAKLDTRAANYDEAAAAIEEAANKEKRAIEDAHNVQKLQDFAAGLQNVAQAFSAMAQVGGSSWEGIARGIGAAVTQVNALAQAFAAMQKSQKKDENGNVTVGTSAGLTYASVYLAAIKFGIDKLKEYAKSREFKRITADVGRDFGVGITEGLRDQIRASEDTLVDEWRRVLLKAKKDFEDGTHTLTDAELKLFANSSDILKHGAGAFREAAELLNLSAIIGEAGGLSASNIAQFTTRLRSLFQLIDQGLLNTSQGARVLNENFAAFAEAGTDALGFLSDELKEIIRLDRQLGVNSQAVTEYLQQQANTAIDGSTAIIGAYKELFEQAADLNQKIEEARKRGDTDALNDLLAQQAALAGQSADQLERLGLIAISTFAAAIASGKSFGEAMQAAAPGLSALKKAFDDLGISTDNAALKALMLQAAIVEKNPELIAGIDGLTASFAALANMGLLNADTFKAMQATGTDMYERLKQKAIESGASQEEAQRIALLSMQQYLHAAMEAAEKLGIPIDENTQALIDQSQQMGIWSDEGQVSIDEIFKGMKELISAIKELIDLQIPDKKFKVSAQYENVPPPNGTEGPYDDPTPPPGVRRGGLVTAHGIRAFAGGGIVDALRSHLANVKAFALGGLAGGWPFTPPNSQDTVPAWVAPGELIMNVAQQGRVAETLVRGNATAGGNADVVRGLTTMHGVLQRIDQRLDDQPRLFARILREEIQVAS